MVSTSERRAGTPAIKGNTLHAYHDPSSSLTGGMERMRPRRGCNFPGLGGGAACTRVSCFEGFNLSIPVPACGVTAIPGFSAFALEVEETFPTISVRDVKNSRNK